MSNPGTLVSIGLPVRNAGSRVAGVVRSVLAQDHADVELVISDNGSTDNTEEVCRELAEADNRIVYHRQPENIGLLNNFVFAMQEAKGAYFRWIGDDDRLEPDYVSRCLNVFSANPRLILVTTGISYTELGGAATSRRYTGTALASDDPAVRFGEMMRLLNASHLLIDPLYGMMLRDTVAAIPRRNMLHEDEIFAGKMALAGPWGHIPDVLAHRHWGDNRVSSLGRLLDVPMWQWRVRNALQTREMLRWIDQAELTDDQRRRAQSEVYRFYRARQWRLISLRGHKLARMARLR